VPDFAAPVAPGELPATLGVPAPTVAMTQADWPACPACATVRANSGPRVAGSRRILRWAWIRAPPTARRAGTRVGHAVVCHSPDRKPEHHRRHTADGKVVMKLLLTSAGISNSSIHDVLVDLLGKPIAESSALFVPTAIYPFPDGASKAFEAISGNAKSPLCDLGWKSLGVLELTALPSIDKEVWVEVVQESDALLVWGGDPVYLSYWMKHSGLADLLPSLRPETVYVGVSAGSIAMASMFGETYFDAPRCSGDRLSSEDIVFAGPEGEFTMTLVMAEGVGLVDFAIIPHVEYDDHQDVANAAKWASRLPVPTYAIDDETAVKVVDGTVEVVSQGHWRLFNP
jgi:dipeptidase E